MQTTVKQRAKRLPERQKTRRPAARTHRWGRGPEEGPSRAAAPLSRRLAAPPLRGRRDFLRAGRPLPAEFGRLDGKGRSQGRAANRGDAVVLPGLPAPGRQHHGVRLQDWPVHPQQRPGQLRGRVPPDAGLRGRLPAPGYMHMMVSRPEQWVKPMAVAGANQYTFHLEATENPGALIKDIRENGMKVGLAIKPGTTVEYLAPWANQIDMALVMTVEPGFGGQKFMEDMMPKVHWLRTQFPSLDIEVDGGVGPDTIHKCAEAGANMIVSGSAIMRSEDPRSVISLLRSVCSEAAQKRCLDR
ncbi:ribulose-phosphate 3-epimerase isoform X2 [Equus asinus]|uniref:ribulose-phosphate 3-epimerase isoform X2 n=1 Tax=Equus asinus TaxID=9793 RepID=UPI0038F6E64C